MSFFRRLFGGGLNVPADLDVASAQPVEPEAVQPDAPLFLDTTSDIGDTANDLPRARLNRNRAEFVSSWITELQVIKRRGHRATARILTVVETAICVNEDPLVLADIEVQAEPTPYKVAMNVIVPLDGPRLAPGDVVDVFVDPKDPRRVALDVADLIGIFFH